MHDFLLAKEIIDETLKEIESRGLKGVKKVNLEIGSIALAHDDLPEHTDDVSLENLEFGLRSIAKNTVLENADFSINKVKSDNWKIVSIDSDQ